MRKVVSICLVTCFCLFFFNSLVSAEEKKAETEAQEPLESLSGIWSSPQKDFNYYFSVTQNGNQLIVMGFDLAGWDRNWSWEAWSGTIDGRQAVIQTIPEYSIVDAQLSIDFYDSHHGTAHVDSCLPRYNMSWCEIRKGQEYELKRIF
ncbi:hypothetical protein [Desulfonatronovibrio magnus]|uniref:hypothetical protein n=1 Tax=Desulfonatronovibrio magnus TaxID=698827 RepID=UPI0005EB9365|nr:hypothetical protein [Desulfonatronovibrio magnus]